MKNKGFLWIILYCVLLCSATVYILLDTLYFEEAYIPEIPDSAQTEMAEDSDTSVPEAFPPVVTENSYRDNHILITLTEHKYKKSVIHVADIVLSDPEYLKTAFAYDAFGKNLKETTTEIARRNQAILAINGDFYGVRERGYVVRNGILYRDTYANKQEDLVIYEDGSCGIVTERTPTAEELMEAGARHILSFGPALVENGEIRVDARKLSGHAATINPRTAIGAVDGLHYVFVCVDGRTRDSRGMTVYELAEFMQSLGVSTAYNLDGGGSATMYFNGRVVNTPTSNGDLGDEREVSDIVYIGYGN